MNCDILSSTTLFVKADDRPRSEPVIMHDMPQMAQFVYDFYRDKIRRLAAQQLVLNSRNRQYIQLVLHIE